MDEDGSPARAPRWRDWMLAVGGAIVLSNALDAPLYAVFGWHPMLGPDLPVLRALLLAAFAAAGVLLAGDLRGAADYFRAGWLLWPAIVLTFVSAIWSEQPWTTLRWAAALLGTSVFGIALAVRFSAHAQSALTAAAVTCIAVGSILAVLLWPAFGIAPAGQWRGLYNHKNLLGRSMALGMVATLVAALNERRRASALIALLLCGGVLLATQSRTSVLAFLVALVAALLLLAARTWRRQAVVILASGAAVLLLGVALLVATKPGLALLGRSETLTDRTLIWHAVAVRAMETPWIGHGYGAFWPGSVVRKPLPEIGSSIDNAHNGGVDLFAELGLAGLVLVLVPLAVFAAAALRHALEPGAHARIWPATYLVFFIASNTGESALLRHKLYWALYVAAACHVARGSGGLVPSTGRRAAGDPASLGQGANAPERSRRRP